MIEVEGGRRARSNKMMYPRSGACETFGSSLPKASLRSYYPETFRTKARGVLTTIEEAKDPEMSEPILSANQRGRQAFLNSRLRNAASLHTQAA